MKTKNKKHPKWSVLDDPLKLDDSEIKLLENYSSEKIKLSDILKPKKVKKHSKKAA